MQEQTTSNIASGKQESGGLSLKDMFYKYIRFLPYFILSVALALLAAFLYLRYTERVFSATGSMQIKSQQNNQRTDRVEDLLSGGNRAENIQSEIQVISSRPVMARVVNRLNLQFSYKAIGRVRDRNVYGQAPFAIHAFKLTDSSTAFTFKIKFIDAEHFRINDEERTFAFAEVLTNRFGVFSLNKLSQVPTGQEYQVQWRPTGQVARAFTSSLRVMSKGSGTGILTITMEADNPFLAADIINGVMQQYDSLTIEQKNYSIDQRITFIDSRLIQLKSELDSLQRINLDYRDKNNLIDAETQSGSAFSKIGEADRYLLQEELKLGLVEYLIKYLQDRSNQFAQVVVPTSFGLEDPVLNELVAKYNES